jgi:single-strand DNA-binding protein
VSGARRSEPTPAPDGAAPDGAAADRTAPRNEVVLVGRVPAAPEQRELPSGDVLVTWRVVVGRPPGRRPPEGVRATTVDTLDCVAWTASARRTASALLPDDVVEVSGALRRRFWRAGAGAASRCEIEVSAVRRVSRRPPRRAAPSPPSSG